MIERITKSTAKDARFFRNLRIIADGSDVTEIATEVDTERKTVRGVVVTRRGGVCREQKGALSWLGYFDEVKIVDRARVAEGRRR